MKIAKKLTQVILFCFTVFAITVACNSEDTLPGDTPEIRNETHVNERTLDKQSTEENSVCYGFERSGCDDNLTSDGCNFLSGEGRDFPNQYNMVDMLNNCRTEPLATNCEWWKGNITETRDMLVDLNNCCYSASVLNARLNSWKSAAQSLKPNSSFLITNYERISGYMVTTYGPYRMKIRVTYRKKICSIKQDHQIVGFSE